MKTRRNGFTLIEVLIVIVIMAVLAATIIPQFTASTDEARKTSIDFTLHTLKNTVQLYKAHHLDKLPSAAASNTMDQLVLKTDKFGTVGTGATNIYGPYLLEGFPINPITQSKDVVTATSAADAALTGKGWGYDPATGNFYAGKE